MFFTTAQIFAVVASAAALSVNVTKRDSFANFFDDDTCNVNGGIGVDMHNDGCLQEFGRGSVYIPNTGLINDQFCLVATHDNGDCSCQSDGFDFTATGFCAKLDSTVQSYRFIHQSCAQNNC